jgi:hypothetical protein
MLLHVWSPRHVSNAPLEVIEAAASVGGFIVLCLISDGKRQSTMSCSLRDKKETVVAGSDTTVFRRLHNMLLPTPINLMLLVAFVVTGYYRHRRLHMSF